MQSFSAHTASKPFLSLFVVRHHTTSSDVILRRVQLEVDNLEVEIDADVLNGLNVGLFKCHAKQPSQGSGPLAATSSKAAYL